MAMAWATNFLSFCCLVIAIIVKSGVLEGLIFEEIQEIGPANMSITELIGKNQLKSAATGEVTTIESLWEKQPVVITFFRRWGCILCRVHAQHISAIKEDLDANNVRLVGVGVEDLGKEDFIKGNFFNGELFIDDEKKTYKDMKYKRYSRLGLIPAMFSKSSRDGLSESRAKKIEGDLQGDYYQVGGTLVVSAGGEKILLNQKQEALGDHVHPNEILKSLGLPPKDLNLDNEKTECKLDEKSECQ